VLVTNDAARVAVDVVRKAQVEVAQRILVALLGADDDPCEFLWGAVLVELLLPVEAAFA
jgi:hypothetical protein